MTAVVLAFGVIILRTGIMDQSSGPPNVCSYRDISQKTLALLTGRNSAAQAALDAAFARGKLVISGAVFADLLASLGAGKASQISF